jgi:two-component system response regulator NreC
MSPPPSRNAGADALRVLLVDDHSVVRAGLRFILDAEDGIEIVGEAGTADEALEQVRQHLPDIVFMDISLPGMGGIELTRRIRREYPETRIIVLTFHEDAEYFERALQAGASGYVVKGARAEDLLQALYAVRDGGTYLDTNLAGGLVSDYLDQRSRAAFGELSEREREVAELIIEGLSNQEVGLRLNISVTTVQTHRSHIMEKLNLRNYGELIRYAIRHGVIQP